MGSEQRFGLAMIAFFVITWGLFSWKFVEIQRWSCTHILNCGCGNGYKAVYHGVHQEITCKLEEARHGK